MSKNNPYISYRSPSEQFMARLAAYFPDLVDPDCERSMEMHTDPKELMDWLEEELKEFTALGDARGSRARIGRLILDRARNGKPKSTYVMA